jgi:hypothetical protein
MNTRPNLIRWSMQCQGVMARGGLLLATLAGIAATTRLALAEGAMDGAPQPTATSAGLPGTSASRIDAPGSAPGASSSIAGSSNAAPGTTTIGPTPMEEPQRSWNAPRRPWFGGIGYASIAPFFGDVSALESGLRAPEALGESYGIGQGALLLGGGGGAVLFGHLWVGGKGFGLLTSGFSNARGDASLTGAGGAFELGYVLSTSPKMLFIPYFGIGGFSYNLEITNNTAQPMPLLNAFTLAPGEARDLRAGFATLEAGLRVHRLFFSRDAGMTAGFEVGLLRSLTNGPWLAGRSEFTHEEGAKLDGVYARVNIGGGGFVFR